MKRQKQISCVIGTCDKCGSRYEVKGLQSVRICEDCNPIRKCVHGVKVTEPCKACIAVHGNRLFRVM
jgi:hypothetical protein